MSANVAIPIAGFKDVYDVTDVEKALQELSPTANEALRALYEKMLRLGGHRFTVKPSALPEMERLLEGLPNFTDVLDKASADGQYDPLGALYELLEIDTATRFIDEFVELPIDASGAVWLATANEPGRIPEPLLNRLTVYEIEAPDAEGSARIAASIYREMRNAH